MGAPADGHRYLRFGPFHIDVQRQQLFRDGVRVKLYGKAYQVLVLLLERAGEIVTREHIRQRLWHMDADVNVDANINTTVNRIRLILKDKPGSPAYIDTVPRKGYCFVGKVEMTDVPPAGAGSAPAEESAVEEEAEAGNRPPWLRSGRPWFAARVAGVVFLAIALGFLAGRYWSAVVQARTTVLLVAGMLAVALISYRAGQSIVSRASRASNS